MMVDDCSTAVRHENENDQTSMEDRAPCEIEKQTPGANKYININTPLQLGGRSNSDITFPDNVLQEGLNGCIKNLMHNGEVGIQSISSGSFYSRDYRISRVVGCLLPTVFEWSIFMC